MKICILIFLLTFQLNFIFADIEIRFARIEELKEIIDFDRKVSFEFFEPLYKKHYSHFHLGKNPAYYLDLEIKNDEQTFPDLVNSVNDQKMLIAFDNKEKKIAGLLTFHKEEKTLELDLLLVDKNYRRQGIGRKLILESFTVFHDIKDCIVTPLRFGNDSTLKFYESLGFKNLGIHTSDKLTSYGIKYKDMYYYYKIEFK